MTTCLGLRGRARTKLGAMTCQEPQPTHKNCPDFDYRASLVVRSPSPCLLDCTIQANVTSYTVDYCCFPVNLISETIGQQIIPKLTPLSTAPTLCRNEYSSRDGLLAQLAEQLTLNPLPKSPDWGIIQRKRGKAVKSN